ncbi:hypothetical protein QYF61_023141 [Mycteria americana]|uniref:Uncharacterized protein n=1 Tax=Mycteria americana TaxID=33587 RepID=A0AAN7PTH2_MYCAM|nr:hypothetical protein QYF61_023141 [Mycteria americana]
MGDSNGMVLNHFTGQPVPMLDNPFSEVKFPNIQSKPPLAQLEAISSRPITSYLGEETDPHLSTTSFQAKQPQFPQPLLIRLVLQTLHQLRCPSLDTLQHLNVSLVVKGPKPNTVFEVRPHQCRVQGDNHFPTRAAHTISDTSQDAIGLLVHLGTLLAHIQPAVNQHSQVLLCWAAFQPLFPKPVVLHGVVVAQVQDPALSLVEPHTTGLSPVIQPVQGHFTDKEEFFVLDHVIHTYQQNTSCTKHSNSTGQTIHKGKPSPSKSQQSLEVTDEMKSILSFKAWRLNHFPGQPVPMLDNPLGEEKFPNIQSKPPLAQLEAISSCPITCYLGEETDPHLSTTSCQVAVESDEVSPQPPFLQAKQSQLPQPRLIRLLLQTLHQLRCPSLYTLQYLNIPLVVGGPKLNTVFEVWPHQCRVQGHNHFPSPAGHTIFDTSQDAIGLLGHLGTLLAHIQAAVNQHSQVLLCQAAFQPLFPKPVALHGVAVAQSLPTRQQINTPTQLGVICKLTESALDPFVQIIDKDVK